MNLREVIDKLYEKSTTFTPDPDSPQVVYYEDAVDAVVGTLDALIEELQGELEEVRTDREKNGHKYYAEDIHESDHGTNFLSERIDKLKQAREDITLLL